VGQVFEMDPCIPSTWKDYTITWRIGATRYEISVANPERRCRGIAEAMLDGAPVDSSAIPIHNDGATHQLRIVLGDRPSAPPPSSGTEQLESAVSQ
jgi:cyclic beta-1,2-glucan synthetase